MSGERRFFIAHAKDLDEDVLQKMKAEVQAYLDEQAAALGGKTTPIATLGYEDWTRRFKSAGSWDAWIHDVVVGIDYTTREPRFHALILPTARIGRATMGMVQTALRAGKPVLLCNGGGLARVKGFNCIDRQNFKAGWEVTI